MRRIQTKCVFFTVHQFVAFIGERESWFRVANSKLCNVILERNANIAFF